MRLEPDRGARPGRPVRPASRARAARRGRATTRTRRAARARGREQTRELLAATGVRTKERRPERPGTRPEEIRPETHRAAILATAVRTAPDGKAAAVSRLTSGCEYRLYSRPIPLMAVFSQAGYGHKLMHGGESVYPEPLRRAPPPVLLRMTRDVDVLIKARQLTGAESDSEAKRKTRRSSSGLADRATTS